MQKFIISYFYVHNDSHALRSSWTIKNIFSRAFLRKIFSETLINLMLILCSNNLNFVLSFSRVSNKIWIKVLRGFAWLI